MAKGRKKLPDQLKIVQGTFRKHRASGASGQDEAPMTAPEGLSETARVHFATLKESVGQIGLDSATYTETLALAAMRLAEIDECNAVILEHGRIIVTSKENGEPLLRANPAVTMRNEAMRHLQSLLAEFGLTPTAATRVSARKPTSTPRGFGGL